MTSPQLPPVPGAEVGTVVGLDLDDVRNGHVPWPGDADDGTCSCCGTPYPCVTRRLADEVAELRDQRDDAKTDAGDAEAAREEAEDQWARWRERAEKAEAQVARLRAGESDEPFPETAQPAPAQLLRHLNEASPDERMKLLGRFIDAAEEAAGCFIRNHEGRIESLQRMATRAIEDRDNAWRRQAALRDERDALLAQVTAVRALPHADACCARGCVADRGPCCGSQRCTCYLKKILAALDGAVPPPADLVTAPTTRTPPLSRLTGKDDGTGGDDDHAAANAQQAERRERRGGAGPVGGEAPVPGVPSEVGPDVALRPGDVRLGVQVAGLSPRGNDPAGLSPPAAPGDERTAALFLAAALAAPALEACGRDAGKRPGWMSPGQYDPCPCVRPKGHEGPCGCRDHDRPADAVPAEHRRDADDTDLTEDQIDAMIADAEPVTLLFDPGINFSRPTGGGIMPAPDGPCQCGAWPLHRNDAHPTTPAAGVNAGPSSCSPAMDAHDGPPLKGPGAPSTGSGTTPTIWQEVHDERVRAHVKHGQTSMESADPADPTGRRLRILTEELGEVAKEWNEAEHEGRLVDLGRVRKELIQVAAMAGAWADALIVTPGSVRPSYGWEPVIFRGGHNEGHPPPLKGGAATTPRDFIAESITMRKGLTGAKPPKVCEWILDLLGHRPGLDTVHDLFPGTGIFGDVVTGRTGSLYNVQASSAVAGPHPEPLAPEPTPSPGLGGEAPIHCGGRYGGVECELPGGHLRDHRGRGIRWSTARADEAADA
jgi:hypothetical protein